MSYELYWIAGSPFAWRALLGLTIKGVEFESFERDYPAIDIWMRRIEGIPGFDNTVPPNWRN